MVVVVKGEACCEKNNFDFLRLVFVSTCVNILMLVEESVCFHGRGRICVFFSRFLTVCGDCASVPGLISRPSLLISSIPSCIWKGV